MIFIFTKINYSKYNHTFTNSIITFTLNALALGNILPYYNLNVMITRIKYTDKLIP